MNGRVRAVDQVLDRTEHEALLLEDALAGERGGDDADPPVTAASGDFDNCVGHARLDRGRDRVLDGADEVSGVVAHAWWFAWNGAGHKRRLDAMRKSLLVGVLIVAGCADTDALEKRVEKLEKELGEAKQDRKALEQKLDEVIGEFSNVRQLERKIDDLSAKAPTPAPFRPTRAQPDPAKTYAAPIEGAHADGKPDAKVTMVWAYEYACPYCEKVRPTIAELRQRYGDDLRVVYQHLVVHPQTATASALASCAADKQGKFARMDEALWEKSFKQRRFDKLGCERDPGGCELMTELARGIGLDLQRFQRDMKDCDQPLRARQAELKQLGANATPTFFINGRHVSGARPATDFEAIIDEELQKANQRIAQGASQKSYYEEWVMLNGEKMLTP